ncbi:MAG TPA: LLM class flavin-dependent oxidoreductase [Rhodanobacteraceae bacterium]|nr:LLM class flavin-dependent oxidoreductase [Rhodanobacteraceae bacterium]
MKFSLLVEAQLAMATPEAERQLFHDIVAQAELADQLGYHAIWAVEHHGLYEYSHCSAPEVLLGFIAARTRSLRLGHAVSLTPGRYNHPVRVAERIATLDILSRGRVNWGSGKSASRTEQEAFEIDRESLDSQWREALEMIPRMWRSDLFEHSGPHYTIPPTAIIPKPVQKPNPPIYMACSRPESIVLAGQLGIGSLNFAAGPQAQLAENVRRYHAALATTSTPERRTTRQFCCTPAALVLEDDREACEHGFRGARYHQEGLATYFFSPQRIVGSPDLSVAPLTASELSTAMATRESGGPLNTVIGDPTMARRSVERFRACGVDELILVMQMGTIPQEMVLRSLRTFAEKVMPHFRE